MKRDTIRELTAQILSFKNLDSDARNLTINTCAALEGFSSTEQLRKAAENRARKGCLPPEVAEAMRTLCYNAEYVMQALARRAAAGPPPEGAGDSSHEDSLSEDPEAVPIPF